MLGRIVLAACVAAWSGSALPAAPGDVERLSTFAEVIGRALACGADTRPATQAVGRWMDERWHRASRAQHNYVQIFASKMRFHFQQQKEGESPESCPSALRTFQRFEWP